MTHDIKTALARSGSSMAADALGAVSIVVIFFGIFALPSFF